MQVLADHILRVRAANPGPLTLSGTNSYLVGRDPAWLIDPGPSLPDHVDALLAAIAQRGGLGGIAITHEHSDHREALAVMRARTGSPPVAGAGPGADVQLADGTRFGPLLALATPGHADGHFAFLCEDVCFSGDAILGEGSVFIAPQAGALAAYLAALRRLASLEIALICPGHGEPITEPRAKIAEYIAHREERERKLVAALGAGLRAPGALLDAAWSDVPQQLRSAAALSLTAHLHKLLEEGRLPAEIEPDLPLRELRQ
ncbi:MAG TPA: MBL fold metallo-hydrolase [Solirubrobacteraceae bacterium]|nr:MBL fold metallo-hydrolase [Solirubrobacteraceae bacterium]